MFVSAYCRSGQTFIRHALELFYDIDLPETNHTTQFLKKNALAKRTTLVPFRNPLDAIASWHYFNPFPTVLSDDIAFWKRYYTYVLENPEFIILLDFDKFTIDLNYLITKIGKEPCRSDVSMADVKSHMATNRKDKTHLPNPERDLTIIKMELETMSNFQELLPIYNQLKGFA